jgi:hypothetical protein
MSRRRLIIAVFLAVALAASSAWAGTYENTRYWFSFEYPEGYTIESSSDRYFTVRDKDGHAVLTGDVEDINLYPRNLYDGYSDPFQKFGTWRALLRCDADGPDGSAFCPSLNSIEEFKTQNGLRALELMLMHVQETFGEKPTRKESVTGPLYLVDLTRNKHTVVLMLGTLPYERMNKRQKKLAGSILDTIRFTK